MKQRLLLMFLVLLGLGQSLQVRADGSADYFRNASNFYWTICGDAEIEFTIPVFIWESYSNDGVRWGYIYASINGGDKTEVLYYRYDKSRDQDEPTTFEAKSDGNFQVTNTTSGTVSFTRNDGSKSWKLKRDADDDDHHTAKIRWKVPYLWRGKSIKLSVKFRWDDMDTENYPDEFLEKYKPSTFKDRVKDYDLGTYDCPLSTEASINLNDPMLAFDKSSAGYIMIPWYAQLKSLRDIHLRLVDAENGHVTIIPLDSTRNNMSGYANIPMDRPYSSVVMSGRAVAVDGTVIPGRLESSSIEVPMLHTPNHMTASMKSDGKVVVRWKIDLPNTYDIMDNDMFEVQRNMTGSTKADDPAWTTVAMEQYERKKGTYEIIDSFMLDRYEGKPVTYRVRRQATSMWGWVDAAKYAQVQIPANMALFGINDATVTRSSLWNDEEHHVDFNFNMSGPEYDNEGRFIVRNDEDWERKQSLQITDGKTVMVLTDENDWKTFVKRVNDGASYLNAVMLANINIMESELRVGTESCPYRGSFNGFGNTLTVDSLATTKYLAPFGYVGSATISNLTVDGRLKTGNWSGGLVGMVKSNASLKIEQCVVNADIESQVDGDASTGGLIGIMEQSSKVSIKNSAFTGSFSGEKSYNNSGFIGVALANTTIDMTNCLFNPSSLPYNAHECQTFVRADKTAIVYINNCYYTKVYGQHKANGKTYYLMYKDEDWKIFANMVKQANGNAVNVILMNDINIEEMVGSNDDTGKYVGTFDGNGHTITANIKSEGSLVAPFQVVGKAEIKNLTVKGSIEGGIHSSGLIGGYKRESTPQNIYIDNVIVSANITTTDRYAGGFVGHGANNNTLINNCRFDGTITATGGGGSSYAGAFIGWEDGGTKNQVTNCYENGTYVSITHSGMNYSANGGGSAYGNVNANKNNYSAHNWSELGNAKYKLVKDDSSLASNLGSEWTFTNGKVLPVMHATQPASQGTSGLAMSTNELREALGNNNWQVADAGVLPVIPTSDDKYNTVLWDKRAKLQLRINMHGENGVESKIVDLSDSNDALKKHQFRQELTRKCVDYSFDLMIIRAKSPLKIEGVKGDTAIYAVRKTETGDLANYRFQNSNRITKVEAKKKQSSVELTWETSGGDHDFFRVLRRLHSDDESAAWTDTIANNLNQLFFEDTKVLVYSTYDYRVESVYQCEGTNIESMKCTGACETTGMIEGYLRLADGTAIAGDTVYCAPVGTIPGADAVYRTVSDETGYFVFRGLPFQLDSEGKTNGNYRVWVATSGDRGSYTGPSGQGEGLITFGQSSNWSKNFNFYMDTYYVLSGNVYYRDTSIPVPGASFKLDGQLIHDASQNLITTDTQGGFTLSIPKGNHKVQVVKHGHKFANDGFLENHDATDPEHRFEYNFNKNVAGVCFWDSTSVMLRGRVVGGDVEGSKPLGKSLSQNNLGDSIKIVMQLEGDNASYLIRKQDDETVKSASYTYHFGAADEDVARMDVTRRTLTIRPDAKTGEYQVMLHPAKYKVTEISGDGYATLFQQGKVGETLDLSFNVEGDTCEYNRIYHAVPTVDVTQFNPGNEKYYGVKKLTANDNIGNKAEMTIWYQQKNKVDTTKVEDVYAFGYPVFMGGSPYGWILQACEKYYWNNKINGKVDIVNLSGGKVKIQNALTTDSKTAMWEKELDGQGGASYVFTPDNTTFTMEGDNALKNVSITLEYDNSFYDIKPFNGKILQGYVMATRAKSQGRKTVVSGTPQLFDILRDPPGGGSSAYIDAGTKLSYGYNWELNATLGFSFKSKTGKALQIYNGMVAAPSGSGSTAGKIETNKVINGWNVNLTTVFGMSWTYNYNIDITERIQTSTSKKWIGSKADIFIGTTENVVFEDAMAVRIIPDSMYQIVKQHGGGTFEMTDKFGNTAKIKVPDGTTKVLAKGTDITGQPVYLVRDEVMQVYPEVKSTFVHTQHYIENELLPDLMKIRNSLLLPMGTADSYAQTLANQKGYVTYVSTVDVKDKNYGLKGYYTPFYPDENTTASDSINALNQEMYAWISMLAKNEQEKLSVQERNLIKRYDFDGAANIQYSENFSFAVNGSRYCRYPLLSGFGNLLEAYGPLAKAVEEALKSGDATTVIGDYQYSEQDADGNAKKVTVAFGQNETEYSFKPIIIVNFNDKFTNSETHSKKAGFTLSASSKSSLTVDVYRTETQYTYDKNQNQFYKLTDELLETVREGRLNDTGGLSWVQDTTAVYSNFVFRTRAGVTCEPYEKERVTKWYQPGTVLDVATVPADKPRIWIDEPVVSNVPFDQPARFTLHMANESDYPERASLIFNYYLLASSNPNGAKVLVEGTPINSQGVNIVLYPCRDKKNEVVVFTKEIEVWPGKEFDYNDLTLCLYDPDDANRVFDCKFSAHFVPTAGKVNVSMPGTNWVVNTESPYDGKRQQWYMPVRIDGFDTNYRGFDHIELQYKLTTQGDKDWVSVCSYYADKELMEKASGVTDTIPSDGIIVAKFYGEADPIEQRYDLRAVNYCRHGNGFLTGYSPILTGIKDTRLPVAFGTPEPTNGILGIGDDIKIQFSEPIAGNYLRTINNFEMLGTPNSNDISTSTSLSFDGSAMAFTQGSRNLSGKSFTVDVMLNPSTDKEPMTVFAHGGEEKGLRFGLTADRKLTATINGNTVTSDKSIDFNNSLHEVAYALDQTGDSMTVNFFDGSSPIGSKPLSDKYEGASTMLLGFDSKAETMYKGEMLEFRLWNRAMEGGELSSYSNKKLTGYESGLLDYYPLNEGEGEWSYDKAPGSMDLSLIGTSWKRPAGISMKFDGKKGLLLDKNKFLRDKKHDYTLTFWFQTNDSIGTIFANGEAERGHENQINIGVKDRELYVRSSGFEKDKLGFVSDGSWHHFAMTVNRSQNVANVYVDKTLVESFAADSLSGIASDQDIALGATYKDKNTVVNGLKGHVDEVGMFSSVLPVNLIKEYSNHTPLGTMSAMMAYLDFGRSEKQDDNTQHLEPTGISLKRYIDSQGKVLARRDTLVATAEVEALADRSTHAPMVSNAQLSNLNYSFVANDNELYIDVNEPDFMIEKTNVYVTVKEVPDLQGNLMASPITLNLFVYRNPLRWDVKRIDKDVRYGDGVTFEATVKNLSGVTQNYALEDLPVWISASQTRGTISALDEEKITFTISPYINIGTYNEQIALVGENKMSEPLPITLRVRGFEPDWAVSEQLKQQNQTMMMVARVKIDGVVANSEEDILGVFDENQQVLGVSHIEVNETNNANEALAYLTIYGYTNPDKSTPTLNFRFFKANTGGYYKLTPADGKVYTFQKDELVGSADNPVILEDNVFNKVWWLALKKGWNWVTIPVAPKNMTVGQFLNGLSKWEAGDIVMSVNGTNTQQWTCRQDKKSAHGYKWDNEDQPITIIPTQMYSIYSMSNKTVYMEGEHSYADVTVHKDWNRIGYTTAINLPVALALSDYTEKATEGDIIKSQDAFAVASRTSTGLIWKGTLQYMEAGKGYMLKRLGSSEVKFSYPIYWSDNRYSGNKDATAPALDGVTTLNTMNIVASVGGVQPEEGDHLVVYIGGDKVADAVADEEQNYYLNIGNDDMSDTQLTFALERNGEIVAMTGSQMTYAPNKAIGTPAEPTEISFVALDQMPNDGKWYTLGGIRLDKKPTQTGHYIYNGKVKFVK